jgi:hypothetical protein
VEHHILTTVSPESLRCELEISKATIERELSEECFSLAYPNGSERDFSPEVIVAAREAGYEVGFTLCEGINRSLEQPLMLDRLCQGGRQPLPVFKAQISGLHGMLKSLLGNPLGHRASALWGVCLANSPCEAISSV